MGRGKAPKRSDLGCSGKMHDQGGPISRKPQGHQIQGDPRPIVRATCTVELEVTMRLARILPPPPPWLGPAHGHNQL